jgi:CRISPR-associated protein Cas2
VAQETMLYIVAYDIPNDRRRSKVHKTLCGYGAWTQYSLFECWLDRKQLLELQVKLLKQLNEKEDSLRLYPLCQNCQNKAITIGSSQPSEAKSFIF